jgi:hypothetical protein
MPRFKFIMKEEFMYYCQRHLGQAVPLVNKDDAQLAMILCTLRVLLSHVQDQHHPDWLDDNDEVTSPTSPLRKGKAQSPDRKGKGGKGGDALTDDIWKAQKLILKGLKEVKDSVGDLKKRVEGMEDKMYETARLGGTAREAGAKQDSTLMGEDGTVTRDHARVSGDNDQVNGGGGAGEWNGWNDQMESDEQKGSLPIGGRRKRDVERILASLKERRGAGGLVGGGEDEEENRRHREENKELHSRIRHLTDKVSKLQGNVSTYTSHLPQQQQQVGPVVALFPTE